MLEGTGKKGRVPYPFFFKVCFFLKTRLNVNPFCIIMLCPIYQEVKESENKNNIILESSMSFLRLPKEVLRYNGLK